MKKKILLLEDHPIHQEVIFDGLEDMGFEVKRTGDVLLAKKILDDGFMPDLFLFDIVIQTIKNQGIQFAEELKKKPEYEKIPVLFITAHIDEENISDYFSEESQTNVLPKPFDFDQLVNKIRQVLTK
ncbi:response regulator [Acidobacteriota bacterium]